MCPDVGGGGALSVQQAPEEAFFGGRLWPSFGGRLWQGLVCLEHRARKGPRSGSRWQ